MKIVVAMKQVPDLTQLRFRDGRPVLGDAVQTYGDLDKNALEAAVRLKEAGLDAEIVVLSVGSDELEDTAKEALASGADSAYLLVDEEFANLDPCETASLIAKAVGEVGDVDLVLMGEGSGDNYSGQMAGRVSEVLAWPQLGFAGSIAVSDGRALIERFLEDRIETVSAELPAVVSVVADINEVRIPAVTQILKAGRKPKEVLDAQDVGFKGAADPLVNVLSSVAPENKREGKVLGSVEELVAFIKDRNVL